MTDSDPVSQARDGVFVYYPPIKAQEARYEKINYLFVFDTPVISYFL